SGQLEDELIVLDNKFSERDDYVKCTGFHVDVFKNPIQHKELLEKQKEYMKTLMKWLMVANSLDKFIQMHQFKGEEWMFCGETGKKLLEKVISLINYVKGMLLNQYEEFFSMRYLKWGAQLNGAAPETEKFIHFHHVKQYARNVAENIEHVA